MKFEKSYSLVSKFYIAPAVIHSLIQLTRAEEFSETENIFNEIRSQRMSACAKKRHSENYGLKNDAIAYYENNIDTLKNGYC